MEVNRQVGTSFPSIYRKVGKIFLKTLLGIFILLLLIILLVQTPYVQNMVREKAQSYLSNKFKTTVKIGKLYIGFPQTVELTNVYIEDKQKDTLISGGSLQVNINMWKLFHNEIAINEVRLSGITAKINRQLPDTTFNFQFIADAFSGDKKKRPMDKKDATGLKMSLNTLVLDSVKVLYNDIVTGNDIEVRIDHANTKSDELNPSQLRFGIPLIVLRGVHASVYQNQPLQSPSAKETKKENEQPSVPLLLRLKEVLLQDVSLDYHNAVSSLNSDINIGELKANIKAFELTKQLIELNELVLSNSHAGLQTGKQKAVQVINQKVAVVVDSVNSGWRITAANISLNNNNIWFDDNSKPRISNGMDYAHIKADKLSLQLKNLLYSKDSITGTINSGSMTEQSGFVLNKLQTEFLYSDKQAYLKNLVFATPGTALQRSLHVAYPSLAAIKKDPSLLVIDIDLQNSKIQLKDILTFVPALRNQPIFKNSNAIWQLNTRIKGTLASLNIPILQFSGLQDTKLTLSGTLKNITNSKKISADLIIDNISSCKKDLTSILAANTLPANITIPEQFKINGRINGGMEKFIADLQFQSTLGNASIKGSAEQITRKKNALYDLTLIADNIDLGIILQDKKTWGPVSASLIAKGRGYDLTTSNADVKGIIQSIVIKGYQYHDFNLTGNILNQQFNATAALMDPSAHFSLDASGNLATKYPSMQLKMYIDSIKTFPLHLTADKNFFGGIITADFPSTNPDSLEGTLSITKSLFIKNDLRVPLDSLLLSAGRSDSGQYIKLSSDAVRVELNGQYKLTQMGSVFQQAIEPYFSTRADSNLVKTAPYDFTLTAGIANSPLLKSLLPDLKELRPVILKSRFTSENGWQAYLQAPLIISGTNKINNLQAQAVTSHNQLEVNAAFTQLTTGSSFNVYQTNIAAVIGNNNIDFTIVNKDQNARNKYRLAGTFRQPKNAAYVFYLKPDSLLLNYDAWSINRDNEINITNNGINISRFELSKEGQLLSLNSQSPAPDAPLDLTFKNFKLTTLTAIVQQDSLGIGGTLDGKAGINNIMKQPTFTSDLTVNNFSMNKDTIGNINLKVNNKTSNTFAADIKISGQGNDVQLTGNYYVRPDNNSSFDIKADIRKIELHSLEGISKKMLRDASGVINGKLAITGNLSKPIIEGDINFNKTRFNLGLLNSYFNIDQEKMAFTKEGVHFDSFTIADSSNNKAILDGMAYTSDFQHYKFDLTLRARDFHALNTTKKDNKLYYGQLYFNTNLQVKGTETSPVVDGRITINGKTKLTMLLPQKEPGVEERDGIVQFVNMNEVYRDSLLTAPYDSMNRSSVLGMDVSVNIEVQKEAELNLIVDEGNGDFLNVRGEALLNAGIDPGGKVTLTGSYELEGGSYELTFNLLKRKFDIQKGSKIIWKGEPTEADVDITALYIANTAPLDLVQDQMDATTTSTVRNTYRQKLPFEVDLKMKGQLLKPAITFDILLPDNKNYVVSKGIIETINQKLTDLRTQPSELNKQVFALLLLNRFVSENPFQSSTGITAESFARASVSKIFTEQLNQLATDLIKGVEVNFDVVSQDDYTTGNRQSKTDLNVALSKRLLNDRLTVTVGSNFGLEGTQNTNQQGSNIAGNIALDYQLSKDGRYALRAYRKNDYQGILEGYIIETGIGFIITIDYNHFREIFKNKKERAQRKEERGKNAAPPVPGATTTRND